MGVAHLAHLLADKIYDVQRGELDIRRSDVKCAEVAGACGLRCTGNRCFFVGFPCQRQCWMSQMSAYPRGIFCRYLLPWVCMETLTPPAMQVSGVSGGPVL